MSSIQLKPKDESCFLQERAIQLTDSVEGLRQIIKERYLGLKIAQRDF